MEREKMFSAMTCLSNYEKGLLLSHIFGAFENAELLNSYEFTPDEFFKIVNVHVEHQMEVAK